MENILSTVVPKKMADKYCIFPLSASDTKLEILMAEFDIGLVNSLRAISGREIGVRLDTRDNIRRLIDQSYKDLDKDPETMAKEIVDDIISQAIGSDISDIHIEPFSKEILVRYRSNGDLVLVDRLSLTNHHEISTIIKLRASCDITEKRLPQDGRFSYEYKGQDVDIRLSTIPTIYGEKLVMRILNKASSIRSMEELGFSSHAEDIIGSILDQKCGMIIVSGPTGSGKSSTVYSLLNQLKDKSINITTIEDPVEYKIDGINQVQVNYKAGLRFDNGLKSILRQDPDCIVVGEIRDVETAQIAMRAAITGHLVITTLHTNDAISAIVRLEDMGIDRYMINSALVGVIAQRLVKKKLIIRGSNDESRTLIYEILQMDDQLRSAVKSGWEAKKIRALAIENGMVTYEDSIAEKN